MGIFRNKIKGEDRQKLWDFFNSFEYEASGASFSSLYMWRDINEFTWEIIGDYLCIEGLSHLELEDGTLVHFMMPPLTSTGEYDADKLRETVLEAKRIFEDAGYKFSLRLIPGHMTDIIREALPEIQFADDRANYDYIYEVEKLKNFAGRKLHSKKNHLNYFKNNYQYEYAELTSEMTPDVMKFIRNFNEKKELPPNEMRLLKLEEDAMEDVFWHLEELGYRGCVILIDGKIQALAAGGLLGSDTIVEHIEKANTQYRGLYQLVLSEFCKNVAGDIKYINREEDMDLTNLRDMKLSYKPVKLLDKYIGTI
ncbi:MAG: DUF2156 domain-containing protein [Eubacterium sp.]|nr:DUF2156 domain-containing protein [Candidatus Colimonas fimequi]